MLALRLLGALRWLKDLAGRYPWQALLILALCWGAYERRHRTDWRAYAKRLEAAQKAARTAQAIVNQEPARVSGEIARQSDAEAPAYHRSVAAAADAHRLRGPANCPSYPDLPRADRAPAINDGSDPAAELVSRPRAEDDQIVAAAGRALLCKADADALIAAGVAVAAPLPEKGTP